MQTLLDWYRADVEVQPRLPLLSTYLGHVHPKDTYWYLTAAPELLQLAADRLERSQGDPSMSALAPTLQAFFTERLIGQRHASPNTIAAYRDTLRLLLAFAAKQLHRQPCELDIGDLDAPLIAAFLDHLENERGNSVTHPQRPAGGDPLAVPLRRAPTPRTRPRHRSACSRSHPNAQTARSSRSSTKRDRRAARKPPTARPGPADATTRCC